MSSNYQMFLNAGEMFRFPVLPEKITVSYAGSNDKINVCGIGEVVIIQDSAAAIIQFKSFFPQHYFSGCNYTGIPTPKNAVDTINGMKTSKKPVRFTIAGGIGVSMYATIESFETYEQGGDPGTIYYTIKLKEYREVNIRKIQNAKVVSNTSRTDNTSPASTYTVVKGDCLWNIAKKYYGSGSKYTVIYNANKAVIGGNSNLIYPGQVFTIPPPQ